MANNLLEINNLTVTYGDFKIITEVSFSMKPGEIVCIAGESGCGKSTLIKAVLGIKHLGAFITEGNIILDGRDITHLSTEERRQILGTQIGYVPQNTRGSFNNIRTYDVQYQETMRSHNRKFVRSDAIDCFDRLNFPESSKLLSYQPWEMSGGMNQRMAIALAVLQGPKLMLCDEATSVLDVTSQKEVIEELAKLRDELGWSILFITHNLGVASHIADKLGVMYAGRMVEYGNIRSVLDDPIHPYTRRLLAAIPGKDRKLPLGLEGRPPLDGAEVEGCNFVPRCQFCEDKCSTKPYSLDEIVPGHFASCAQGRVDL
ncbi:ABC transporter ATP-binding protein [Eubacteriales bacterium OttesenSCG-928-K08]|nr:ABC transporter ATP-binding protein [Eubacteriales bacterium OttesenSCG-928-K08]